ncbi:hypothetical protein B0H16DRAFT_1714391 [Mycena metata]|uniref:F-box domain-containing protein n=1 Tax=Mycena metata TaxID=1033252 RepID=A0AAD7JWM8_9AGAR|nr:hypothetical protein B0H16DRAFT_1714391 [Mycena metata]
MQHSTRIAALNLVGEALDIQHYLAELPHHDFPILNSLALDASGENPPDFVAELPDIVLNGGIPGLKELKLTRINLPWPAVRGLESLSLTKCNDSSASSIQTFDMLFAMLELCPQLKTLQLNRVLPQDVDYPGRPAVHLSHLTSIDLRDHAVLCCIVLKHLKFPLDAQVLVYSHRVRTGMDARQILVPIRRHLRAPTTPKPSILMIECYASSNPTVPANCMISTLRGTTPSDFEHHLRQTLSKVVKAVAFEHITHLGVRMAPYLTQCSHRWLLERFPALETAFVIADDALTARLRA